MPWRVQATWTVDGERKSYAPQFARTRLGAAQLKRQMEKTLAHFPTLEVIAEKADAQPASGDLPAVATEPVHLIDAVGAPATACGLQTSNVACVALRDIFEMSGAQCSSCQAATHG